MAQVIGLKMKEEEINGIMVPTGTIIYEPREYLDIAIIGHKNSRVLYSHTLLIHAFMKMGFAYEEAIDWISYNILGLECNEGFPRIIHDEEFKEEGIDEKFANLLP